MDLESIELNNPSRYNRIQQIEKHTNEYIEGLKLEKRSFTPVVIRIPVVVHVLHNGSAIGTGLNISMAQIESQIEVLNEDFRRLNADAGNTPMEFQSVAADAEIEFYLACIDPNGNPTDGVIRVNGAASYTVVQNNGIINEATTGIKLGANG
ncbi:hypothetical protein [Algoriphagus sp.]|uniref:hypothetical protein n=1 Tax=Algoriphagus sp. TaxID=1872435 RepID=UPI003F725FC0